MLPGDETGNKVAVMIPLGTLTPSGARVESDSNRTPNDIKRVFVGAPKVAILLIASLTP